jgi:uncharacterized protein YndB with AHSA1/START domain
MAKLEDRDLGWVDRAPVRVEIVRTTAAPPDRVFAVLADHAGWPTWFKAMRSARADGDGAGVGATRSVSLGPLTAHERFIAWEPGRRYSFVVLRATFPGLTALVEDFRLEPTAAGGTLVTYVAGIEPARAVKALGGLIGRTFEKQVGAGIDGLVAHVDAMEVS